jgi:hypothetical protein
MISIIRNIKATTHLHQELRMGENGEMAVLTAVVVGIASTDKNDSDGKNHVQQLRSKIIIDQGQMKLDSL